MANTFRGMTFDRDRLPAALTQFEHLSLKPISWEVFASQRLPTGGGAVGSWSTTQGDPLAEILVVRDEDFQDTLTWLNSFFAGLSPITQWCRVLPQSSAERISKRRPTVGLGAMLGAWVGAVIAECSVQAGGVQNLRDLPGSAAASSATFAAGRAISVWNNYDDLTEIARRHDELSQSLRDGVRRVSADALTPIWSVLSGGSIKPSIADKRALEPLASIVTRIAKNVEQVEPAELVAVTSVQARDSFDLPEIAECAMGPQVERVRALDRLGERLSSGPRSPAVDALLGLAASFVDPGSAVAPELLRRYAQQLPTAPIWQGLFAGALVPLRVMTDQGGLGRLIAKALLTADDLHGRPSCDIAYDELARWITPGRSLKLDVRGMSARILSVELVAGVTCTFPYNRTDPVATPTRTEVARGAAENRASSSAQHTLQDLDAVVMNLVRRVERLESRSADPQRTLGLAEPKDGKSRRGSSNKS